MGIAAGVYLGGGMPVVMFQNSGLGNAVNPFTSLIQTFEIPILMIATLRGDPENETDEPQHQLMGKITTQLLDLMEVSWSWFPRNENELIKTMGMVKDRIVDSQRPHVLVMKKDSVEPYDLTNQFERKNDQVFSIDDPKGDTSELFSRKQVMELIIENTNVEDETIIFIWLAQWAVR